MDNLFSLGALLADAALAPYRAELTALALSHEERIRRDAKGQRLLRLLEEAPPLRASSCAYGQARVRIGTDRDADVPQQDALMATLQALAPWRKGPFEIFGAKVESEWASFLKWNRLKDHIQPLAERRILDIGCGNGYYMFRMKVQEPQLILGIEPYLLSFFQWSLLERYAQAPRMFCLPVKLQELPSFSGCFDTIFCMGVLYHQRSPLDTLQRIRTMLAPRGELVLETLILAGEDEMALCPKERYAKMGNVYFIPTVACARNWLSKTGFTNIRCISVAPTTVEEQHATPWAAVESLGDFLDANDPARTVEGYPAPVRAILLAENR
ncbi:MAG: tRNA 5-methoxyuridine(34)/uridine 5-oxyacetic acid(34) synthase CmoB [Deltaproteobacteria bacterium]|nr:tRNA 5-methoxyuridine(34)/uridine 5-oxyacetic acid(34) synthase CmoB [Deltaproteobacteria bacterium]